MLALSGRDIALERTMRILSNDEMPEVRSRIHLEAPGVSLLLRLHAEEQ